MKHVAVIAKQGKGRSDKPLLAEVPAGTPGSIPVPELASEMKAPVKPKPDNDAHEWALAHGERMPIQQGERHARGRKPPNPFARGASFDEAALKVTDLVGFNMKAESAFVYWLSEAIAATGGEGIPPVAVVQNAAFELGISIETAKRYLLKYTAIRAPFHSDGKRVTLKGPVKP
jgi:hypothetical protein